METSSPLDPATSKHMTATPSLTGATRTHFTFVFADADVPDLAALRHRFDPDMAAIVPPHVTAVYPEEHANLHMLVERARSVTTKLSPFTLTGVDFVSDSDAGDVAVFVTLDDASGTLQKLRNKLLSPASSIRVIPIHLTIVHPRTSVRGDEARDLLADQTPRCHLQARSLSLTVTDPVQGMRVIEQFPLTSNPRSVVTHVPQ